RPRDCLDALADVVVAPRTRTPVPVRTSPRGSERLDGLGPTALAARLWAATGDCAVAVVAVAAAAAVAAGIPSTTATTTVAAARRAAHLDRGR
ncbi:MAG: hypothetical protein M0Z40_17985, partial [Actinomycetota bacterium]|nr:hypothetical protein [Actinomycetota bacterium]